LKPSENRGSCEKGGVYRFHGFSSVGINHYYSAHHSFKKIDYIINI